MLKNITAKRKGFTLIELAIVMVIIALLIAGILSGKELLQQARVRTLMKQIAEIFTDYNTFLSKYGSPPGDLANASTLLSGLEDGDGDGLINTEQERKNVFLHMKQAKLLRSASFVNNYLGYVVFQTRVPEVQIELLSVGPSFSAALIDEKVDVAPLGFGFGRGPINVIRMGDLRNPVPTDLQEIMLIVDKNMDDGRYNDGVVRQDNCDGSADYMAKSFGCKAYVSLD